MKKLSELLNHEFNPPNIPFNGSDSSLLDIRHIDSGIAEFKTFYGSDALQKYVPGEILLLGRAIPVDDVFYGDDYLIDVGDRSVVRIIDSVENTPGRYNCKMCGYQPCLSSIKYAAFKDQKHL